MDGAAGVDQDQGAPFDRALLLSHLIEGESERLIVYDDATGKPLKVGGMLLGNPSIGIGRNLLGKGITKAESRYLVDNDIRETEEALDVHLPWWRQHDLMRQIVLAELCFELGINGLLKFRQFLYHFFAKDYARAGDELRSSLWFSQVGRRARRMVLMMDSGQDVSLADVQ